jgi:hypothetical protein
LRAGVGSDSDSGVLFGRGDCAKAIVETGTRFMVVKIRLGRGPVVTRRQGKNSRIAMLAASLLTLVSISCGSLGMWRIGSDLAWAGEFVFPAGLLSHWQVWIGAAIAVQYVAWRLTRYARTAVPPKPAVDPGIEPVPESAARARAVANV